jgi:hypothetical protein
MINVSFVPRLRCACIGVLSGLIVEVFMMYFLYGSKPRIPLKLVATFGSEQQLRAYVHWATLADMEGHLKFEQGSALGSYDAWSYSSQPLTEQDPVSVVHNPSPSML